MDLCVEVAREGWPYVVSEEMAHVEGHKHSGSQGPFTAFQMYGLHCTSWMYGLHCTTSVGCASQPSLPFGVNLVVTFSRNMHVLYLLTIELPSEVTSASGDGKVQSPI